MVVVAPRGAPACARQREECDSGPASLGRTSVLTALLLLVAVVAAVLPGRTLGALHGTSSAAASGSAAAVRASATPGYAFATVLDGRPVRWNPCEPVLWTANLAGAPKGGLAVLRSAVARVAAASGTTWRYVGPTSTKPTSAVLPRSARRSYPPVVLGWTDSSSDLLRGQRSGVLAMTRTAWFGVQKRDGSKVAALRSAVVALDRRDRLPLRGAVSWEAVVQHELAHAMGLAHVGDRRQLMATVLPRAVSSFQAGDRAGLARVGRPAGCVRIPG